MTLQKYDAVVIGAGQSGLTVGYYLKKTGLKFLLLDNSKKAGNSWRNRYDSLILFTQRRFSSLPGLKLEGRQSGYPTKDEIAEYLDRYINFMSLPVTWDTNVSSLLKREDSFLIETTKGRFLSKVVVVATGVFQTPKNPDIAGSEGSDIWQTHSSEYRNPTQIPPGKVLVVGGGNSGAQIAVELSKSHLVDLSCDKTLKFIGYITLNIIVFLSRYKAFEWLMTFSKRGSWFDSKLVSIIIGTELKDLIHKGLVKLKPKVRSINKNGAKFEDSTIESYQAIIWSIGFTKNYSWIHIPGALNTEGSPIHKEGISKIKNLYFVNFNRRSQFIGLIGIEAKRIVKHLLQNLTN